MSKVKCFSLFLAAALCLGFGSVALADGNGGGAEQTTVTLAQPTRGQVLCTAAINEDGTVANCFSCSKNVANTFRVGTGQYQVAFTGVCDSAEANKGWSSWVQVDTLTINTAFARCTTADRNGVPNAVWVACFDAAGAAVDASFFLFLAR